MNFQESFQASLIALVTEQIAKKLSLKNDPLGLDAYQIIRPEQAARCKELSVLVNTMKVRLIPLLTT